MKQWVKMSLRGYCDAIVPPLGLRRQAMQRPAGRYNPKDILRSMAEDAISANDPLLRQ
jgi:hypothetical protein